MFFKKRSEEFIRWAQYRALPLSFDDPDGSMAALSDLDDALWSKRIVYLGEEDHWIHEKTEYRMLMLRYLISRGFRYIGEELGFSDGYRINGYIQTGDESLLSRIATYGYAGDIRPGHDNAPKGVFAASASQYPVAAFGAEQSRLIRFLRKINETLGENDKLFYFGFDINTVPEGGCLDAEELLKSGGYSKPADDLVQWLIPVEGESVDSETDRLMQFLADLRKQKDSLLPLLGQQKLLLIKQSVQNVIDSLRFRFLTDRAPDYRAASGAMARREIWMRRHIEFVLRTMTLQDKLVLMAHNRHLAKNFDAIRNPGGAMPGGGEGTPIGTYFSRAFPNRVYGIWMLFAHGQSSHSYPDLSKTYEAPSKSLNALLEQIGDTYLLPVAASNPEAKILRQEAAIMGLYNIPFKAAISEQADAIFFTKNVSELQK